MLLVNWFDIYLHLFFFHLFTVFTEPDDSQELVTFSSGQANEASSDTSSTISDRLGDASTTPSMNGNREPSSVESASVDRSQALMSMSIFQNGSSIFQGYGYLDDHSNHFSFSVEDIINTKNTIQ